MSALFELDVEPWAPVYKPYGHLLLSAIIPDRCRDCGRTMIPGCWREALQGGNQHGMFTVCDDCGPLDVHWSMPCTDLRTAEDARESRRARSRRDNPWMRSEVAA